MSIPVHGVHFLGSSSELAHSVVADVVEMREGSCHNGSVKGLSEQVNLQRRKVGINISRLNHQGVEIVSGDIIRICRIIK